MGYFPSFDAMTLDGDSSLPTASAVSLGSAQPLADYSDDGQTNAWDVVSSALKSAGQIGTTLVTSMTATDLAKLKSSSALQSQVVTGTLTAANVKSIGSMLIIGAVIVVVIFLILRKGL
jgi:hypothetical protein